MVDNRGKLLVFGLQRVKMSSTDTAGSLTSRYNEFSGAIFNLWKLK